QVGPEPSGGVLGREMFDLPGASEAKRTPAIGRCPEVSTVIETEACHCAGLSGAFLRPGEVGRVIQAALGPLPLRGKPPAAVAVHGQGPHKKRPGLARHFLDSAAIYLE